MSATYFYVRDGNEVGPLSAGDLRTLAVSGELKPRDFLRKDGTDKWVPCSSVKGLFPETTTSSIDLTHGTDADHPPSPPPLPEHKSAASALDGVTRESLAGLKSAAKLTAKRAERTKLLQIDLPAAYLALGQAVFECGTLHDRFSDEYRRIDAIRQSMLSISQRQSEKSATLDGVVEKAKASASRVADIAEHKTLQIRLNTQLRDLGTKSFDKCEQAAGLTELVDRIARLRSRVDTLEVEAAELAQSSKTSTSEFVKLSEPLRRNVFLIAASLLFCFPAGLLFIWRHPRWTTRTKSIWTGAFFLFVAFAAGQQGMEDMSRTNDFHPTSSNRQSGSTVDAKLVLQLRPGMTQEQVIQILGRPHKTSTITAPGVPALAPHYVAVPERTVETWSYNPDNESWIVVGFENGTLFEGGTGGYSLTQGFGTMDKQGTFHSFKTWDDVIEAGSRSR